MKFILNKSTIVTGLILLMVSCNRLKAQLKVVPETKVVFERIQLLDKYVTEGASIGDVDIDGSMDVIAGSIWWKGPDFKTVYAYAPVEYYTESNPGPFGYSVNFFTFSGHFDNDKWIDILQIGLPGTDAKWVKNPGKNSVSIDIQKQEPSYLYAQTNVGNESPMLVNVIGDKEKELLAFTDGKIIIVTPPGKGNKAWETLAISEFDSLRANKFSHGLGVGDINMDGLTDVLEKRGWWEQPKNWNKKTPWKNHKYPFSPEQGGAQMSAYDIDGDGDNDVITAMNAHRYGLSWYEQIKGQNGIDFIEHKILTDHSEDNPYGISFSQLHALDFADIDNDGVLDVITGKCYKAHRGNDPGSDEPAVLYWFKTTRNKDGSVDFVPYLIDDNSGVGRQITAGDLNNDGKIDVVVGNRKGVFAFIQK